MIIHHASRLDMHKLGLMFHHYQRYINQHIKRDTSGEIDSR